MNSVIYTILVLTTLTGWTALVGAEQCGAKDVRSFPVSKGMCSQRGLHDTTGLKNTVKVSVTDGNKEEVKVSIDYSCKGPKVFGEVGEFRAELEKCTHSKGTLKPVKTEVAVADAAGKNIEDGKYLMKCCANGIIVTKNIDD